MFLIDLDVWNVWDGGNRVPWLRTRLICPRSISGKLVNLILVDIVGGLPNIHVPPSAFLVEPWFFLCHAASVTWGKLATSLALEVGLDVSKPITMFLPFSSAHDTWHRSGQQNTRGFAPRVSRTFPLKEFPEAIPSLRHNIKKKKARCPDCCWQPTLNHEETQP